MNMTHSPDINISVILTAHREGRLAHPAHMSALAAMREAKLQNISSELIIILDRSDDATRNYFLHYKALDATLIEVDFGDPGLARNTGIRHARGQAIAFLDADDLWGNEWLALAYAYLSCSHRTTICHPQISQVFGERTETIFHPDQTDSAFS